jgi:hypothetical protein
MFVLITTMFRQPKNGWLNIFLIWTELYKERTTMEHYLFPYLQIQTCWCLPMTKCNTFQVRGVTLPKNTLSKKKCFKGHFTKNQFLGWFLLKIRSKVLIDLNWLITKRSLNKVSIKILSTFQSSKSFRGWFLMKCFSRECLMNF